MEQYGIPQYWHKKLAGFKHKKHKFSALVNSVNLSSGIMSSSEAMLVICCLFVFYFFLFSVFFSVKPPRHENSIAAFISCLCPPSKFAENTQLSFLNTSKAAMAQKSSGFWHKATFKVRTSKFGQHCGGELASKRKLASTNC